MTSREHILAKIEKLRKAKGQNIELAPEPVASGLKVPEGDLAEAFKTSLELVQGECYIHSNIQEVLAAIKKLIKGERITDEIALAPTLSQDLINGIGIQPNSDLSKIKIGITGCELLAAQTGTAILTSKEGRKNMALSPIHVIIAQHSQLRRTLDEAVKEITDSFNNKDLSQLTLITGPSRTADIEKTLILGAHGPKRLVVYIY